MESVQTAIVTTCQECGHVIVAGTFDDAVIMYREHTTERSNRALTLAVSNPMGSDLVAHLLRKAHVMADENKALAMVERWRQPAELPRAVVKTAPSRRRWNIGGRLADWFFSAIADLHYGGER